MCPRRQALRRTTREAGYDRYLERVVSVETRVVASPATDRAAGQQAGRRGRPKCIVDVALAACRICGRELECSKYRCKRGFGWNQKVGRCAGSWRSDRYVTSGNETHRGRLTSAHSRGGLGGTGRCGSGLIGGASSLPSYKEAQSAKAR